MNITQDDIDFLNEFELNEFDHSKASLLRMQKINNELQDKTDNYCMCSLAERKRLKRNFLVYWNTIKTDIQNVGL